MIAHKGRENRRSKAIKMPRNVERLYKEGKCRDCSVVVTRMDFAKILGKFTKVKIQYESSSSPKSQKTSETATPSNTRLKNNENGMVLIRRNVYNQHPVKNIVSTSKKLKTNNVSPVNRQVNNVLKEKNSSNTTEYQKGKNLIYKEKQISINQNNKCYAIVFDDPTRDDGNHDNKCDVTLLELLPKVDKNLFPSEGWCIDYFPKNEEPTDDKVYDRIAAELEDLMYNEKPEAKVTPSEPSETKVDDFPSIMDILNDNNTNVSISEPKDQSTNIDFKNNLESSDVEAMLLGNHTVTKKETIDPKAMEPSPMEIDSTDVKKLIDDVQFTPNTEIEKTGENIINEIDNPHSPSILDEALQKGIEEHLPCDQTPKIELGLPDASNSVSEKTDTPKDEENSIQNEQNMTNDQNSAQENVGTKNVEKILNIPQSTQFEDITHIIFKKVVDGVCQKSVSCPKNLKYRIELEGKSVELLGAPNCISSYEDLQVLLQIVNETDLNSLYVLY